MPLIDYDVLQHSAPVHREPFTWVLIDDLFSASAIDFLVEEYPTEGFTPSISDNGHYRLDDQTVVEYGTCVNLDHLSPLWREVIADVMDPAYRRTIAQLTEVDLSETTMKVRLCKYPPGGWMLPHTDQPRRVVTQIIYLNPEWEASWGGHLQILGSERADDVVESVSPKRNRSVLFVRSDTSYHAVTPVDEACGKTRRTLLVQFTRE